jgi:hypothetical protein
MLCSRNCNKSRRRRALDPSTAIARIEIPLPLEQVDVHIQLPHFKVIGNQRRGDAA